MEYINLAALAADKLMGKKNLENYRALYESVILVFHFGTPIWRPKLSARRKKDFDTKGMRYTSECFDYHFELISISEKHFKSAEILISVTFEITLS